MKRKRVAGSACRACVPKACLVCILYLVYKNTFDFSWQSSVSIAKQDFNGGYFGSCFLLGGLSTKQHMNNTLLASRIYKNLVSVGSFTSIKEKPDDAAS